MSRNAQIGFFQSLLNTIVSDVFLLDEYPNAKAAYSLRKLSSTYAGSCIRVRRSSDNTEQDIGFVGNELDTTSLLSFVGANNGYVTTWYNQKGTGDNLNNITAINQPLIVNSGVVETVNGKPAILGDSNDLLAAGDTTTFKYLHDGTTKSSTVSVMKTGANVTSTHFYWLTTLASSTSIGVNNFMFSSIFRQRARNGGAATIQTDGSIAINTQYTFFQIHDVGNATNADKLIMNINNGSDIATNTSSFTPSTGNSSFRLSVFNYYIPSNNLGLDGHIQEMIFWNDDYSADKSAINTNINDY
jgi:hypothetical protein